MNLKTNTRYERFEDMSPDGRLGIMIQPDGDVIVAIYGRGITDRQEDMQLIQVEFCFPGSGGGQSSRTRAALQAVAEAIRLDNEESPQHRS